MCRNFLDQSVSSATLDAICDAALGAPAAGNTHGLHLVVLQGPERALYWDTTLPQQRRAGFRWPGLLKAGALVVPYVDPEAYVLRYSGADKEGSGLGGGSDAWSVPYWFVDGGAAVMAMLLCAEAAGLGALFFGQFSHEPRVRKALGVPSGLRALGTVALGHRAAESSPGASEGRGRPSGSRHVHHARW